MHFINQKYRLYTTIYSIEIRLLQNFRGDQHLIHKIILNQFRCMYILYTVCVFYLVTISSTDLQYSDWVLQSISTIAHSLHLWMIYCVERVLEGELSLSWLKGIFEQVIGFDLVNIERYIKYGVKSQSTFTLYRQ